MKILLLLLLLVPIQAYSQKATVYTIPKNEENGGGTIIDIEYPDSLVTFEWFPRDDATSRTVKTKLQFIEDVKLSNDTLWLNKYIYRAKNSNWIDASTGKPIPKIKPHHWQLEHIKAKYPDYYNKYFAKK